MNRNSLAVGLAFFVTTLTVGRAEAGQIPFKGSLSGTSVSTEMDIDGDGAKNSLIVGGAKSTQGSSTVQGPGGEFVFSGAVPCPDGSVDLTEATGTAGLVFRFERTGDLLIEKDTSFTQCFDLNTGLFFGSGTGVITGGTGRFAGATGPSNILIVLGRRCSSSSRQGTAVFSPLPASSRGRSTSLSEVRENKESSFSSNILFPVPNLGAGNRMKGEIFQNTNGDRGGWDAGEYSHCNAV